jgi:small subunit ribosomal protein S9
MTEAAPQEPPVLTIKPGEFIWGTGRRKSSVARVRLNLGEGKIEVNRRPFKEYFPVVKDQLAVLSPLKLVDGLTRFDVFVNVNGGGLTGQAGAILLGISRALVKSQEKAEEALKAQGFLTRDSRMKERKKYGLRGARRAFQFSKR